MDAAQAKAIADRRALERDIVGYLNAVETAAKEGRYEFTFGNLNAHQVRCFRALGFKVFDERANIRVSWGDE